jgi:hypothetical protein
MSHIVCAGPAGRIDLFDFADGEESDEPAVWRPKR